MTNGEELEGFGGPLGGRFRGEGPNLNAAMQQAARAAAQAGYAGRPFAVVQFGIEPQDHNQWIRTFWVIIEAE